jgi:hypothetical protein
MPGDIPPMVVLHNLSRILDELRVEMMVLVIEVHPEQLVRVEQPVVMVR